MIFLLLAKLTMLQRATKIRKDYLLPQSENWALINDLLKVPGKVELSEAIKKAQLAGTVKDSKLLFISSYGCSKKS
jgi:hypothetical protein